VKVAYDDQAIYIAARMDDTKPVTTLLGRRDTNVESDWFRIYIDAQHDRLTGASFWVNPSNVQLDKALYNDIYDDRSWDAVWKSAARIVPGGWVAEVKIPYSQLRFPDRPTHTWGINFARRIASNQEMDWLVNTPKGQSGTVSRFADLVGIEGIRPERALEVVPYGVARSDLASQVPAADPFARASAYKMDGGVDVRYGITSNLRLTGTINPDFGQVEVDPAVLNLSQFETFFPEKRPFFTEGASFFNFGNGPANFRASFNFYPPSFFYSRRIGRSPQGTSNVSYDYLDAPSQTTILGAAKITGRLGKGWSIGVLDALTDAERARYQLGDLRFSQQVEPRTNYVVGRITEEYGNSQVGVLVTSVDRRLPAELSFLRNSAHNVGIDGYTKFHKNDWLWEWLVGGTNVEGSKEAIASTQTSSAHGYDRPDADYLTFDRNRTSLSGFGWRTMVAKQTGKWRPIVGLSGFTPGFETNDVGFMPRADEITSHFVMNYVNEDVTTHFRERSFWIAKYQNWNFGHDLLANGLYSNWFLNLKNYWYQFGWAGAELGGAFDDRKTRGGPVARRPRSWNGGIGLGSDSRKKLSFEASVEAFRAQDSSWGRGARITAVYRPATRLTLQLSPSFTREYDHTQYVTTIADPAATATYGAHYVFAGIDQNIFELGTRADWTVTSTLSVQLYLQPFIAAGDYHGFRELARPRTRDYVPFNYGDNPDFDFRSLRGSAVVRWEFRPGSALYVVWNENRADTQAFGNFRLRRDISALRRAPSNDVFLVKVSYWLPL